MKNLRAQLFATAILVAFGALFGAAEAQAGTATSITGLYTTGSGTGTRDTRWRRSDGSRSYVVTTNMPAAWVDNTASARWISYSNNAQGYSSNAGPFTYTLSFEIEGDVYGSAVSNVSIFLTLAVDDSATISVNGAGTGVTASGWASTSNVTLNSTNSNFVVGINTITISVLNSGYGGTGLFVSSIAGVVPEAGTWAPLAVAFGLLAWIRFRPRKQTLPAAV